MANVVVIDDEEALAELYAFQLQLSGHVTVEFNQSAKALAYLEANQPDMVVTDLRMPHVSGVDICRFVRKTYPLTKLIVVSGFSEIEDELSEIGVDAMLKKPFSLDDFGVIAQAVLNGTYVPTQKFVHRKAS